MGLRVRVVVGVRVRMRVVVRRGGVRGAEGEAGGGREGSKGVVRGRGWEGVHRVRVRDDRVGRVSVALDHSRESASQRDDSGTKMS